MSKIEIQPIETYLIDDNGNEILGTRKVIEYCVFNTSSKTVISCHPTLDEAKKVRDIERRKEKIVEKVSEMRNDSGSAPSELKP